MNIIILNPLDVMCMMYSKPYHSPPVQPVTHPFHPFLRDSQTLSNVHVSLQAWGSTDFRFGYSRYLPF